MKKKEACRRIDNLDYYLQHYTPPDYSERDHEAMMMAKKALEQEPSGEKSNKESIPFLMHKELNVPISECQKAYDVAIEYLRSHAKVKC